MKTYTLTLFAKPKDDGSYEYSLSIWENRGIGSLAREMNFESESLLRRRINPVLPGGGDINNILPQLKRDGDYWFPFAMPMSDQQAANLGWLSKKALKHAYMH